MKDCFGDGFAITLRVRDRLKMVMLGIALNQYEWMSLQQAAIRNKEALSRMPVPLKIMQNSPPRPHEKSESQPRRVRNRASSSPSFSEESSLRDDPILWYLDLVHTAKGEEELH
jgi:hypothetical protein